MADTCELIDLHATDVVIQHTDDGAHHVIPGEVVPEVFAALRDVVKLHTPFQYGDEEEEFDDPSRQWCEECTNDAWHRCQYPCRTVRTINAALEVPRG